MSATEKRATSVTICREIENIKLIMHSNILGSSYRILKLLTLFLFGPPSQPFSCFKFYSFKQNACGVFN